MESGCDGWYSGIGTAAVLLQYLQGERVGFYLAVSPLHLPRLAKVVESLVRHQETKTSSSLLSSRERYSRFHWTLLPLRMDA